MIVLVMAISNLVLTRQIYSQEANGAHAHYREPVPLTVTIDGGYELNLSVTLKYIFFSGISPSPSSSSPKSGPSSSSVASREGHWVMIRALLFSTAALFAFYQV